MGRDGHSDATSEPQSAVRHHEGRRRLGRARLALLSAVVVLVPFLALVLLAGGRSSNVGGEPSAGEGGAGASAAAPGVERRGSRFVLTDIDGRRVVRPNGKPGAIFFVASSCTSCVAQAAALGDLKRKLGARVEMLAVTIDPSDSAASFADFRAQAGNPPFPFGMDPNGVLAGEFEAYALGTTVVYDARGKQVFSGVDSPIGPIAEAFRKAGVG